MDIVEEVDRLLALGELPDELMSRIARQLRQYCFSCQDRGRVVDRAEKTVAGTVLVVYYLSCPTCKHSWEQYERRPSTA